MYISYVRQAFVCLTLLPFSVVASLVPGKITTSHRRAQAHIQSRSLQKRSNIVQASFKERGWCISVTIQGTNFCLWVDTGSAWLWAYSDHSTTAHTPAFKLPNDFLTSTTQVTDKYQMGDVTARSIENQSVTIGQLTVPDMEIDAATDTGGAFSGFVNLPFDGVLGMGFHGEAIAPSSNIITKVKKSNVICLAGSPTTPTCPIESSSGVPVRYTFMEKLIQENLVSEPVFSLNLNTDSGGTVNLGSADSASYTGDLQKVPADSSQGYWAAKGFTFKVGGTTHSGEVIIDTGTTSCDLDLSITEAYMKTVDGFKGVGGGSYHAPCGATLPDLSFTTSAGDSVISGSALLTDNKTSDGLCQTRLTASQDGFYVLGVPFFATHYVSFNQTEPSVSFALQSGKATTQAPGAGGPGSNRGCGPTYSGGPGDNTTSLASGLSETACLDDTKCVPPKGCYPISGVIASTGLYACCDTPGPATPA